MAQKTPPQATPDSARFRQAHGLTAESGRLYPLCNRLGTLRTIHARGTQRRIKLGQSRKWLSRATRMAAYDQI